MLAHTANLKITKQRSLFFLFVQLGAIYILLPHFTFYMMGLTVKINVVRFNSDQIMLNVVIGA